MTSLEAFGVRQAVPSEGSVSATVQDGDLARLLGQVGPHRQDERLNAGLVGPSSDLEGPSLAPAFAP